MNLKLNKLTRAMTRDAAYTYRMPAGFAGDVNRTHPAEIEPAQIYAASPPTLYGQPVLVNSDGTGVRPYGVADQSNSVASVSFGFTVRPFPIQQVTATNYGAASIGAATPPTTGVIDVLRSGLIMAQLNVGVAAPVKGGAVWVWCAATSGNHIQGGLETAASAGNTVQLDSRYTYNGPADSTGVVEVSVNV